MNTLQGVDRIKRKVLLVLIVGVSLLSCDSGSTPSIDGRYEGETTGQFQGRSRTAELNLNLSSAGGDVTGDGSIGFTNFSNTSVSVSGSRDGQDLNLTITENDDGTAIEFEGTVGSDAHQITGTFQWVFADPVQITLRRQ